MGVVLDLNRDAVKKAKEFGLRGELGDATQLEVLERVGVPHAKIVALTIPSRQMAFAALRQIRSLAPHVRVVVRSRFERFTGEFAEYGAHVVVGDEEGVAAALAEEVAGMLDEDC